VSLKLGCTLRGIETLDDNSISASDLQATSQDKEAAQRQAYEPRAMLADSATLTTTMNWPNATREPVCSAISASSVEPLICRLDARVGRDQAVEITYPPNSAICW
jgi:hypothetical protein